MTLESDEYFDDDPVETSELDEWGCIFGDKCLMPGEHLKKECHTVEMIEQEWAHIPLASISPIHCNHLHRLHIHSSRESPSGRREHVSICQECGQFEVFIHQGEEDVIVTFELVTSEQLEAAARYREYVLNE
jgi:hypothetical protein